MIWVTVYSNDVEIMASTSNKKSAVKFLELVVAGKIDQAYEKYVDMKGKHHNAYFPAGFAALQKAMKENDAQFPKKRLLIKNVLGDGGMVAVHSHFTMVPGKTQFVVVHLFRFKRGKIIEMWDCCQEIPTDTPNKDELF